MSNQMKYKGYYGSIVASTEDNCLYGKLLFIRPLVSYEGQTVAELQAAFHEAVDDYLETCQKLATNRKHPAKARSMLGLAMICTWLPRWQPAART